MTSVWGLSCNFSMTSNNEPSANTHKNSIVSFFFLFHYLPNDFFLQINPSSNERMYSTGICHLSRALRMMGHLTWHFSIIFFLIIIKWILILFILMDFFFVMSSFSCETLYGELHLFFIIMLVLKKMCLAQLSKLAELRRKKKIKKSTIINNRYNKTWEAKKKKENN